MDWVGPSKAPLLIELFSMVTPIRNATATIHIFSLTLSTKEQELVQEKQKMDDLLFLTLPLQVLIHVHIESHL